jgi:EamA domain-containing membrane protein RarD
MSRQERAGGYSLTPLVLVILFWVLFEELLRRLFHLSVWAAVPLGLVACLTFFWLSGQVEELFGRISRGLKK